MSRNVRVLDVDLTIIPVRMRLPLKFGAETVNSILCARVRLLLSDEADGRTQFGWGETPLSAAWAWPSECISFAERESEMVKFCGGLREKWIGVHGEGHPLEIGSAFLEEHIRPERAGTRLPHLARLICASPFDLALHDAFGKLVGRNIYQTYNRDFMTQDLGDLFQDPAFHGQYPADYLLPDPEKILPVWHLVGGKDLLSDAERTGNEPEDGVPVTLTEWIRRDGLTALKIKLTGRDAAWDYRRIREIGKIAVRSGVKALSPDFNCQVQDPEYVNRILDRLAAEEPDTFARILYVEQPFPYDLERNRIDVHSCSARKPLFMDESAHDWRLVKLGFELGWNGVALKVCKTQSGAILSACWAKAHGMMLMVQDLTNPMLAMIPHVLLAAHTGTLNGVECNAPQFYPQASEKERRYHPGLYERRGGTVDFRTVHGNGFGYAMPEEVMNDEI